MHPAEVVVPEVQTEGRPQVLPLLSESIRESDDATHRHPHGQVLPLNVACANLFKVRFSADFLFLVVGTLDGTAALLPGRLVVVLLDQLLVVSTVLKGTLDC